MLFKLSVVIGTRQKQNASRLEKLIFSFIQFLIFHLRVFLINLYLITDKVKPIPFVTEHHYILSKDFPFKINKIMVAQASECFLGRVSPETYY